MIGIILTWGLVGLTLVCAAVLAILQKRGHKRPNIWTQM